MCNEICVVYNYKMYLTRFYTEVVWGCVLAIYLAIVLTLVFINVRTFDRISPTLPIVPVVATVVAMLVRDKIVKRLKDEKATALSLLSDPNEDHW